MRIAARSGTENKETGDAAAEDPDGNDEADDGNGVGTIGAEAATDDNRQVDEAADDDDDVGGIAGAEAGKVNGDRR